MWYGAGSVRSASWAGEHRMNLLCSNVVRAAGRHGRRDFAAIQLSHMRAFRAHHPDGAAARISQGLVVIPTDHATAAQSAKYLAYAEARRRARTPQGPARLMFAGDLVGTAREIAEKLYADPGFQQVREAVFALPFSFARRLRADPHRHRRCPRPGARMAPRDTGLTRFRSFRCRRGAAASRRPSPGE